MKFSNNASMPVVLIRGAGDIATGIGHRLYRSGFKILMTEIDRPKCVRRRAAFSEAVYDGETEVEGVRALLAKDPQEADRIIKDGLIAVLVDKNIRFIQTVNPFVLVDATMAKRNLGTSMDLAPIVIGIGPGFNAGVDCHAVIETCRGNNLGRVILNGKAQDNTGIPGNIMGFSRERVIYSPVSGTLHLIHDIGSIVEAGETIARVANNSIAAPIGGVLRGILRNGSKVLKGMKIGDVDPTGIIENSYQISDKARAVGGGVLEAILYFMSRITPHQVE